MRRLKIGQAAEAEVDMTPMLDIVFIMLIFFIVTTSFVKESGIILKRPPENAEKKSNTDQRPIIIDINGNSEILIAGRLVEASAIRANIEIARAKDPKAVVIVRAHKSSKVNVVIAAVDQSRLAGADNVMVVKPAG